jgi:hypothetical protein
MKHILHTSYAPLCDFQWDTGVQIPLGNLVVHVPTDHIVEFFNLIEGSNYNYVVVSSNSDYCIEEQSRHPVEHDMQKWLRFIDCNGMGYNPLLVPARCDVAACRHSDKYSVKVYSWTKNTFNKIPDNVLVWFGTNINIADERIVHIPFGVPEQSLPFLAQEFKERAFGIYCNWQNNTIERGHLKEMLKAWPQVTVSEQVSTEQFIYQLKSNPFIISPPGNGLDCYRTLEAIYCGSIPIIVNDEWSKCYDGLTVIKTDAYANIFDSLVEIWEDKWKSIDFSLDNTPADLYYWESLIQSAKEVM